MKAKDIRKGNVIDYKGAPHSVMEFQHRTPGNLRAFVQVRLRNLITGTQCEDRFSSTEDLQTADVYHNDATFLYADGEGYHFMNSETFEQIAIGDELLGDSAKYLQDGMTVQLSTYNDLPIGIQVPKTVILTIVETQPEMKGATASNSPKPATTDTGLTISVPAFVKVGDKVVVDTEQGTYLNRAEQ
jgi:elongation factor P